MAADNNKWELTEEERAAEREYARRWRLNNPERVKKAQQKWNKANADKVKAYQSKWRERNPDKALEYRKRRAARLLEQMQAEDTDQNGEQE